MTSTTQKLLEQALALPEDERAALADALAGSLGEVDERLSPKWRAEISRRIEAIETGDAHLIPGDEVEERLRKALRHD